MSSTSVSSTATLPEAVVLPATTVGDATGVLSADEVTAFVREQLDAYPVDGRSVCILVPDGTRTCPLPLLLRGGSRVAGRTSHPDDRARRAGHPRRDERRGAGRPPRLRRGRAGGDLSRDDRPQPRVVGPGDVRRPRDHPGRADPRAVRGSARRRRAGAPQPRGRRARHRAGRRAGAAARGRRHLRRQQVLLPRRRGPGHHRHLALAGRADHVGRDHRDDGSDAGARAHRRGCRADPGGPAGVLRRRCRGERPRLRLPCTRSRSATPSRRGRRRPRSARPAT